MKITSIKAGKEFPKRGTHNGIEVKFYKTTQKQNGSDYTIFMVRHLALGQWKMKGFADWDEAVTFATDHCERIGRNEQDTLTLANAERATYLHASDYAAKVGMRLDALARDAAEALAILGGRASLVEVARDYMKRHAVALPQVRVADAIEELKQHVKADGKSQRRQQQVASVLDRLGENVVGQVDSLTPSVVSAYLAAMPGADKTKKNHRDVIGYFGRWLVLKGYLPKGTDLLEGVQEYKSKRKGEVEIFTPMEIAKLLMAAKAHDPRMVPYLAIGAFAGLRAAELCRLDWCNIDFDDDAEPVIEVRSTQSKNATRRLVPLKKNLRSWIEPVKKSDGGICPFSEKQVNKHLRKIAAAAGVEWKHNALRHSGISYRVAECADVPRVAYESDNSPAIIEKHYLRVVKAKHATEWFGITPSNVRAIAEAEPPPTPQPARTADVLHGP